MLVDAHHHLWNLADGGYTWLDEPELAPIRRTFTPADLRVELAAAGVDRSVLVEGGRCDVREAPILLGHAARFAEIGAVVAWADPAAPDLDEVLDGYLAAPGSAKLAGVRAQVQGEDRDYLDRADVRRGLTRIGTRDLGFDLVVRVDQLPSAARLARAVPGTRFVLDHLGKPRIHKGAEGFAEWQASIGALAAVPNVSAKISGLVTGTGWAAAELRPYIALALDVFGPERVMIGSDWPVCLLAGGYGEVRAAMMTGLAGASADELSWVLGGTAAAFYRLGE